MGVSLNGGTQQPWVFLLKRSFWGVLGVPPFKETPTWVQSSKCQTCTWFSPLPSCYLVPPTFRKNPADSLYLTQKLCRTMKFRGRRQIAKELKVKLHHSVKTHSDFQGEMTQHQDFLVQWRHVDDQDQSAHSISSKLAPTSPSLSDGLPTHHEQWRDC